MKFNFEKAHLGIAAWIPEGLCTYQLCAETMPWREQTKICPVLKDRNHTVIEQVFIRRSCHLSVWP